jgi:DNA-binding MarR family transcriptional regulator
MRENETLEQARYIFSTGKMIRDRIFRAQTVHLAARGKSEAFGDLSVPQFHAIMIVRTHGQITMTELSDRLGVSPPSASSMVDRLVEKGILTREHSVEDRRKVVVRVSPEAMEDIESVEETILRSFAELVEKIGPEITRKWCQVLERVKSVIQND